MPLAAALRHQRISIRGARTHNLKNIDLDIPRDQLVVITGLSGSGKSSLAFDTLYAEGQRRYVESLSAYARQFLQLMDKPDVDLIEGLSPAISIEQKATSHNPRSTVGTVTEIHDYLRLLFARAGTPHCPEHGQPLAAMSVSQMVDTVMGWAEGTEPTPGRPKLASAPSGGSAGGNDAQRGGPRIMVMAPVAREKKGEFSEVFEALIAQGYVRFRVNGQTVESHELPELEKTHKHDIDVVVDRLKVRATPSADAPADGEEAKAYLAQRQRLAESFEAALRLAEGRVLVQDMDAAASSDKEKIADKSIATSGDRLFSSKFACPVCSYALGELEPRLFSFNSPQGACPSCNGLGHTEVFDPARVVAFPTLSLASGAIKGWDRRNGYYFAMLESLGAHFQFDVEAPWETLGERVQQVILFGSGDEAVPFQYVIDSGKTAGRKVTKAHPFEGIVRNFERRYRETDSSAVREELGRYRTIQPCPDCGGSRLRREARHVFVGEGEQQRAIFDVSHITLGESLAYFENLRLSGAKGDIAVKVVHEIRQRLKFLNDVGLNYLSLERSAESLSGGEAQRIRLASQIGSGLTGVMYVLDEPSIGLHQRDNDRLIATLQHLRDLGNTVLVVEHDEDMIRTADHVIDMGPGAGVHGGRVMAQGTPAQVLANPDSLTGQFLSGTRQIAVPAERHAPWDWVTVVNASGHNLTGVTVPFPIGLLTCVTGVSGSGKSTLVNDTLYTAVAKHLYRAHEEPAPHDEIQGLEHFDKVINVDQSPIGRTPRSNPATYTGLFTAIRELMAETNTAKERGYGPGRFSFNVSQTAGGGRCEACQGDGVVKVEMHFLPDVYVPCDVCHGQRYNRETLEVLYKGKNIAHVLDMTVGEAAAFFSAVPSIARKLQTLLDVGLSYVRLGQSATTLSGGEAQRVKLALELSKRDTGRTLYILDEPTTGLHFADIELLLKVLHQLRDAGNTLVVIEHNLDVIKTADWLIDMGPEGGAGGGTVVATGTPEQLAAVEASYTGRYLRRYLK
ncbi:MAG: excinuclease ABC subunit UvrA [Polaromonas sp.]|nr:excinuclease ABC subunit UvrA [Polaromonas sp.]